MTHLNKISVLYTTISTLEAAEKLAHQALLNKLVVCVNIIPNGKSLYLWEDKIEQAEECYMIFKTSEDQLSALETWILQHHPYEIPAILKFEADSSAAFLEYIGS